MNLSKISKNFVSKQIIFLLLLLNLFVYELNLKEWILVDNIFQKKFNHEENLFNKIFKYFTINSDNDNIHLSKESKEL